VIEQDGDFLKYRQWTKGNPQSIRERSIFLLGKPFIIYLYIVFMNFSVIIFPSVFFKIFLNVPLGLAVLAIVLTDVIMVKRTAKVFDSVRFFLWKKYVEVGL
jgi:hypothetical protein